MTSLKLQHLTYKAGVMKKLLITLSLLSSFAFACDQPYEEIAGIKVGCNLGTFTEKEYKIDVDKDGFFHEGKALAENGNIKSLNFYKHYYVDKNAPEKSFKNIRNDIESLGYSLQERWGDFSEEKGMKEFVESKGESLLLNDDKQASITIRKPNSQIIEEVTIFLFSQDHEGVRNAHVILRYTLGDLELKNKLKGF